MYKKFQFGLRGGYVKQHTEFIHSLIYYSILANLRIVPSRRCGQGRFISILILIIYIVQCNVYSVGRCPIHTVLLSTFYHDNTILLLLRMYILYSTCIMCLLSLSSSVSGFRLDQRAQHSTAQHGRGSAVQDLNL